MDVEKIIEKFYPKESLAYSFLFPHSRAVADYAVQVGLKYGEVDLDFIHESAMLHDIGIFQTKAITIGCNGTLPYIIHGVIGEELLKKENLPRHASVARTHVGVALTAQYIKKKTLPLPHEDMMPQSIEEEIVAYADKFFSKRKEWLTTPRPVAVVIDQMNMFGSEPVQTFLEWHVKYGI